MFGKKTLAWMVHLYTMSGAVFGMLALIAAAGHDARLAFCFLLIAGIIDATDGLLARKLRVWELLPNFSGAMVDNVVDVLTYIFVPIFIMWWESLLPHIAWIAVPTLAGMYAYGQVNMKTEDNFFLGFPSYWNFIALYMYWIQPSPFWAVVGVVVPAILTVIPTRYLYPSRNTVFWKTSWTLGVVWVGMLLYLLAQEFPARGLVLLSLYYPAYYLVASFYVDATIRFGAGKEIIDDERQAS